MKIATWNLERALPNSARAARQRSWLNRIDADLWILTETHIGMTPGVGYQGIASRPLRHPGVEGECWVYIWVRNGMLTPLTTSARGHTAAGLVTFSNGSQWVVYGTVLPSPEQDRRSRPGASAAFAAALEAQSIDWQRLQVIYPKATLLVAGDFNQDLNALNYYGSRRNKQALRQALAEVGLDCLTAGEHDPVHRLIGGQHSNINHICLTRDAAGSFTGAFAWPTRLDDLRGLSDHFGVGVELGVELHWRDRLMSEIPSARL
ncbi:endonuclease/exonuclease/phosphatase family protein [Nodosilinea sp. LEGE 07088]|uniref:endonuclease/exonuclease/phosphatase family protein n=1 Tax=Nodosilinea sp. LEGE 07088 TaxID=2777968 RepID=UPI00187DF935|nr:endonuclease/exonuclease/phosphatase family protein [Nodosilinea sp. LEGE 07088]MBE9138897.1 endonuclease/exonuclease/phosphatase family protein [Nodosilinea sp. LEGE 07088]